MTDGSRSAVLASLDPRRMELILYPTEQCNFRCTYCYEDFSLGKMSPDTISGVKALITSRMGSIRQLQLSWFGGEPLAAKDVMFDICEHAQHQCSKHDVRLSGHLTTNGYFLDVETARRLQEYGQGAYQISIDGYGAAHDRTRKLMSGGGTFARIWSNMLALRDSDLQFHVMFRIHLTTDNLASMEELAPIMRTEFLHDPRFTVYLKTIENLGNNAANAMMIPQLERDAIYQRLARAFGADQGDTDVNLRPDTPTGGQAEAPPSAPPPKICYAARPNSLAIRANGVVQKCTVLLNHDNNRLGQVQADGRIDLNREKMAYWMRGYDSMHPGELKCPANSHPPSPRKVIPIAAAAAPN